MIQEKDNDEEFNDKLEKVIKEYLDVIKESASKYKETKFAIVRPTMRPVYKWYSENHGDICKAVEDGINKMNLTNLGKIGGMSRMSQQFEDDEIHYTANAGLVFLDTILTAAEAQFGAELIDLDWEMEKSKTTTASASIVPLKNRTFKIGSTPTNENENENKNDRLGALEREVGRMKNDLKQRQFNDNLVTARIREELDAIANEKKEDRLIVNGLTNKTPRPNNLEDRKRWIDEMIGGALNSIEPHSGKHVVFANQGKNKTKDIPLFEVKMDSKELALKIRRQFAAKKKSGADLGRLYIANCVTIAMRVRVDIMKAMATKYSSDKEVLYVTPFTSRPMLHAKKKDENQRPMAYTFLDAIMKYGAGLRESDLGEAYKRAGTLFKGQLQQYFVVLHEDFIGEVATTGGNQKGAVHLKRARVGESHGPETASPAKSKKT